MALTNIISEASLVYKNFAEHIQHLLGWDSTYAWNKETSGRTPRLVAGAPKKRF